MIFGKTVDEKFHEKQGKLNLIKDGYFWFSWFPVQVDDGRWAWLQMIWVDPDINGPVGNLRTSCLGNMYYLNETKIIRDDD